MFYIFDYDDFSLEIAPDGTYLERHFDAEMGEWSCITSPVYLLPAGRQYVKRRTPQVFD